MGPRGHSVTAGHASGDKLGATAVLASRKPADGPARFGRRLVFFQLPSVPCAPADEHFQARQLRRSSRPNANAAAALNGQSGSGPPLGDGTQKATNGKSGGSPR